MNAIPVPMPATASNAARVSIAAAIGVVGILAVLHVLSPEFAPSWRMVSEYAMGQWSWVLSLMFVCWAVSTWSLVPVIRPFAHSRLVKVGLAILVVAGIGEAMAAVFDVTHPLHGAAAFLGILGFPVAAMMLGISLTRLPGWAPARTTIRVLSHLSWLSVVLMAAAFGLFMSQLQAAGVVMSADAKPLAELPAGVTPLVGWVNRVLIVVYCAWAIVVARQGERAAR